MIEGADEEGNMYRSIDLSKRRKRSCFYSKIIDVQMKADDETLGRQTHSDKAECKIIF